MDMEVVEVSLSHGEATTTLKYTRVRNKNNTKSMWAAIRGNIARVYQWRDCSD